MTIYARVIGGIVHVGVAEVVAVAIAVVVVVKIGPAKIGPVKIGPVHEDGDVLNVVIVDQNQLVAIVQKRQVLQKRKARAVLQILQNQPNQLDQNDLDHLSQIEHLDQIEHLNLKNQEKQKPIQTIVVVHHAQNHLKMHHVVVVIAINGATNVISQMVSLKIQIANRKSLLVNFSDYV